MFRVSFFCDDRKLAGALRVLVGVAVGAPEVAPVDTGPREDKPAREPHTHDGKSLLPQFVHYLQTTDHTELRLAEIKNWLTNIGRNPTNAQHVAKTAIRKGHLKRQGEGRDTVYLVVTEAAPKTVVRKRRVKR